MGGGWEGRFLVVLLDGRLVLEIRWGGRGELEFRRWEDW